MFSPDCSIKSGAARPGWLTWTRRPSSGSLSTTDFASWSSIRRRRSRMCWRSSRTPRRPTQSTSSPRQRRRPAHAWPRPPGHIHPHHGNAGMSRARSGDLRGESVEQSAPLERPICKGGFCADESVAPQPRAKAAWRQVDECVRHSWSRQTSFLRKIDLNGIRSAAQVTAE